MEYKYELQSLLTAASNAFACFEIFMSVQTTKVIRGRAVANAQVRGVSRQDLDFNLDKLYHRS